MKSSWPSMRSRSIGARRSCSSVLQPIGDPAKTSSDELCEQRRQLGPPVAARIVGHPPAGGWAELVVVPVNRLAPIPDDMNATTAAALPLAGLTALRLLRAAGALAGRRILLVSRGLLAWFGQAGRTPATIDFFEFFKGHRPATIRHFDYTDSGVSDADDLATLVRLVNTGRLHPEIGTVSSWSQPAQRIADLRERRILGKSILTTEMRE